MAPYVSIAPFVMKRPWLHKMLAPIAQWYVGATGYRQMGLRTDDLYEEERTDVKLALQRLSPKESYERVYRIRRATQLSLQHKILPRAEWTKDSEDVPYLTPLIAQIEAEAKEKEDLDAMTVFKKH